jgi:antirestriction protein
MVALPGEVVMMMTTTDETMRVWVGCLSCYNDGRLIGAWVDATEAAEFVPCDRPGCEEWWVFDTDGLPTDGECSPVYAAALASLISEVEEWQRPALVAWIGENRYSVDSDGLPLLDDFNEAYCGEWESRSEYAEDLAEQCGYLPGDSEIEDNPLLRYVDWDAWTRDLFLMGYYSIPAPRGVFVFRNV